MASAVPPMGEAALLLGVPVGSPLLSLRRTYFERRGRAIEHSLIVRRQMLWDRWCAELAEDLAHLGCEVRRLG